MTRAAGETCTRFRRTAEPMTDLFTAGYQGRDIDEFVDLLDDHDVDLLVDVRDNPYSRKPGFTRGELRDALADADIGYLHVEALGNPTEIRNELDDTDAILEAYTDHMADRWDDALEPVEDRLGDQTLCLMCYERSVDECHRGPVADELRTRHDELTIRHL